MARLAYCKVCKATYPLNIVVSDGGRSGKTKEPTCPMGHTDVQGSWKRPRKPRGKSSTSARPWRWTLAAGVFAVDQAEQMARAPHEAVRLPYRVVSGLRIDLNYNSGISFSRFAERRRGASWCLVAAVVAGLARRRWSSRRRATGRLSAMDPWRRRG